MCKRNFEQNLFLDPVSDGFMLFRNQNPTFRAMAEIIADAAKTIFSRRDAEAQGNHKISGFAG